MNKDSVATNFLTLFKMHFLFGIQYQPSLLNFYKFFEFIFMNKKSSGKILELANLLTKTIELTVNNSQ